MEDNQQTTEDTTDNRPQTMENMADFLQTMEDTADTLQNMKDPIDDLQTMADTADNRENSLISRDILKPLQKMSICIQPMMKVYLWFIVTSIRIW